MPVYSMFRTEMRYSWLQLSSLTRILLFFYLPLTFHNVFGDHFDDFVTSNWRFRWKITKKSKFGHFTFSHVTEATIKLYRLGLSFKLLNTSSGMYQRIGKVFKTKRLSLLDISVPPKSCPNLDLGFIIYYIIVKNAYIFNVLYWNEAFLAVIIIFD